MMLLESTSYHLNTFNEKSPVAKVLESSSKAKSHTTLRRNAELFFPSEIYERILAPKEPR